MQKNHHPYEHKKGVHITEKVEFSGRVSTM